MSISLPSFILDVSCGGANHFFTLPTRLYGNQTLNISATMIRSRNRVTYGYIFLFLLFFSIVLTVKATIWLTAKKEINRNLDGTLKKENGGIEKIGCSGDCVPKESRIPMMNKDDQKIYKDKYLLNFFLK